MPKIPRLIKVLLIAVVVLFVLSAAKNFLIKTAIELTAPRIIGAKLEIGSFSLGLLSQKIHIRNMKLYNPPGYPQEVFLNVPEIGVEADIGELMKGRMHFPMVIFNLEQMIIYKDKAGKLNIDSLKIIEEQKAANKGKPSKMPVFKIDVLKLNIGKVIMEDYSHAPPVVVEAYDVNVKDKTLKNVDGIPKLVAAILVEAVKPTAIRSAGLLAAQTLLGVGFFPAMAVGVVIAQDDVKADFNASFNQVYQESLKLIKETGSIKKEDAKEGQIFAKVYGADIVMTIQDKGWNKASVAVKARKYLLARLEVANGILYQLKQRIK
jgi:hypothetical protein